MYKQYETLEEAYKELEYNGYVMLHKFKDRQQLNDFVKTYVPFPEEASEEE